MEMIQRLGRLNLRIERDHRRLPGGLRSLAQLADGSVRFWSDLSDFGREGTKLYGGAPAAALHGFLLS